MAHEMRCATCRNAVITSGWIKQRVVFCTVIQGEINDFAEPVINQVGCASHEPKNKLSQEDNL